MRELNKEKIYDLSDLTSEEYEKLFKWLLENDNGWRTVHFESWKNNNVGMNLKRFNNYWGMCSQKATHNAKELFYTLENVQVDVLNCTQEEIEAVIDIYKLNNVKYVKRDYKGGNDSHSFLMSYNNSTNEYPIITYSKFMELFGEPQYEVKMIVEAPKPKHYAKGIDTFARMEANCTKEECLAFAKGNIDKYNWRNKGQDLEDYKKIVSYANWAIKLLKDEN